MLCDELKVYVPQDGPWGLEPEEGGKLVEEETCYLKSDVDAAIDELKTEHHKERDEYISMVYSREQTIKELKAKLENVQEIAYAESVDAGMRERRLRRALYKACANWARSERYTEATWHGDEHREELWAEVQEKCRAKAEEYR